MRLNNWLKILVISGAVFLFIGCATGALWRSGGQVTTHEQPDGDDTIIAFGRVNEAKEPLEKDQLVMMGKRFWYVLDVMDSRELYPILTTNLSKPYGIEKNPAATEKTDSVKPLNYLPVSYFPGRARFSSRFCLVYQATIAEENARLRALDFQEQPMANYRRCFAVAGKVYGKPTDMPPEQTFGKEIPVQLTAISLDRRLSISEVTEKVLETPSALAEDAVLGIIYILMMFDFH